MMTKQERYDRALWELREGRDRFSRALSRAKREDCQAIIDYWQTELAAAEAALKGTTPIEVEE